MLLSLSTHNYASVLPVVVLYMQLVDLLDLLLALQPKSFVLLSAHLQRKNYGNYGRYTKIITFRLSENHSHLLINLMWMSIIEGFLNRRQRMKTSRVTS